MFRSASLFIGTSFTVAVFTIFVTSNVDSIVGIPQKIYSMQNFLIHIKSQSLCEMCPSAPRVCSEPGGQKPVLSLSFDRIAFITKCEVELLIHSQHYNDVIMGAMASKITSFTIVYSTIYSGADQRKHQSSASLSFVRGIHRWPVNSPHKWPVTRKMFPFDDVIMTSTDCLG